MLDMECKGKKQKNTLNVLIIEYINFMWYRRDDIISTAERISLLNSRIKYTKWVLSNVYKLEEHFTSIYVQNV